MSKNNNKILIANKKASYEYSIIQEFVFGCVLSGVIVNHIRKKEINLSGKYIIYQQKQLQIIGLSANKSNFNIPLLANKKEVNKVLDLTAIKGTTCIPLEIFRVGRWIKVKVAIVKGRNKGDKREYLKEKEIKREIRNEEM